MEVLDIIIDEQRFVVYTDEWEGGIQQVKTAGRNCMYLRMSRYSGWEELDPNTLQPIRHRMNNWCSDWEMR